MGDRISVPLFLILSMAIGYESFRDKQKASRVKDKT
jgi:hypothetical protein